MSNIEKSKGKIKVTYWCSVLTNVATIRAVLNSVHGLVKYGSNTFRPININSITNYEYLKPKLKINKIGILFKKIEIND